MAVAGLTRGADRPTDWRLGRSRGKGAWASWRFFSLLNSNCKRAREPGEHAQGPLRQSRPCHLLRGSSKVDSLRALPLLRPSADRACRSGAREIQQRGARGGAACMRDAKEKSRHLFLLFGCCCRRRCRRFSPRDYLILSASLRKEKERTRNMRNSSVEKAGSSTLNTASPAGDGCRRGADIFHAREERERSEEQRDCSRLSP